MANRFTAINLAGLTAPDVVETLDYETILKADKDDAVARLVAAGFDYDVPMIESDPLVKGLEVAAYRELLTRARVNDAARAVMLAYAQGSDLDHLGALYEVERMLVTPATETEPAVYETDERFRARIQLAPEAFSTGGPEGAYVFHTLSLDPTIKSVQVYSPAPGQVHVLPLIATGTGVPGAPLLAAVRHRLMADAIRPLTDQVTVRAPTVVEFTVEAALQIGDGPDVGVVQTKAVAAIRSYLSSRHIVGTPVMRSGLIAAAHVAGVERVTLAAPANDIVPADDAVAYATAVTVTV